MRGVCRRWSTVVVLAVGLLAAACSGGGDSGRDDDLRLSQGESVLQFALPSAQTFTAEATATLQKVTAALPQADANDHRAHGGGRPPDTATRDQAAVDQINAFLRSSLAAPRQ